MLAGMEEGFEISTNRRNHEPLNLSSCHALEVQVLFSRDCFT